MKRKCRRITMWRRILACLLAAVFCMHSLPVIITCVFAGVTDAWDGDAMTIPDVDEKGVFLITNGAELAWFANEVNTGNGEIDGRLENTIWLNTPDTHYEWLMIGNSLEHPYRGTFDGNGKKINYLYAVISEESSNHRYGGLFGVIDGGTVSDVQINGTVLHAYATYGLSGKDTECYVATGGIAGYLKNGKIANCVNETKTLMEGEIRYRNAGGIVGICSGTAIRCANYGAVTTDVNFAQRNIGGIAGTVYGSKGQLRYCVNNGNIQGNYDVGGIAGSVKYGAEIQSCCNYGTVLGVSILGGIAGNVTKTGTYSDGTGKECIIRNVYNLGEVNGTTSSNGSIAGGIIGQMGYEDAGDEDTPSMPILNNAYATVQYTNDTYMTRGSIIGYFKSGSLGNVYGMSGSELEPCGVQEAKTTNHTGPVLMKTETQLKSVATVNALGGAFVKTNKYDYENAGFPKLAWQGQTSDLAERVDAAIGELNGWLTEHNRLKYGASYTEIEITVADYIEQFGGVVTEEEYETILSEARTALQAIKPGMDSDHELASAIDEGILTLEAYYEELCLQYQTWTEVQMQEIQDILETYRLQLEAAQSLDQITLLIRFGKDAMDEKTAAFEEEKRLEEIRIQAKYTLELYHNDTVYEEPWNQQIQDAKNAGLAALEAAGTVSEVRNALSAAQDAIDTILGQIPGENAWDGISRTVPILSEEGVYQIGNGAELAWFAEQVNTVSGMNGICGELTGDINLGNQSWTPIGGTVVYTGTFDGNGYTVRGLNITDVDTYAGLFGAVYGDENQSIVNVTVAGTIRCPTQVAYAGGIVGYIYGTNESRRNAVENCHSRVNITISKVTKNDSAAGGIAGYARNTWFRNCSNKGIVSIDSVGKGGIPYFTGGILGYAAATVSIRRSYNAGFVWADYGSGGLVGKVSGSNCELTSNYNSGEVQATTYAGGLVGQIADTAAGSIIKWSYNCGAVNLGKSGEFIGAIVGSVRAGSFEELYALSRSDQISLALVGYAADHMFSGQFVSSPELQRADLLNHLNLGGNYFIRDYLGIQNGYPIFQWQLTLTDFKSGAITDLKTFVTEDAYTAENWAIVSGIIEDGIRQIQNASDMESVNEVLTKTKSAVYEVESKADLLAKELEAAKDAAILELQSYVDPLLYRDEEQTKLRVIISDAVKQISLASDIDQVEEYRVFAKDKMDRLPTKEEYLYEQDLSAAMQVDSYITNIGEVVYTDYVKIAINLARNAYDALTDSQKALVTQLQVLLLAEETYARLEQENTVTEQDQQLAAQVDMLISTIGDVGLSSGTTIEIARHAYNSLTDIQKTLVTHPEILFEAEKTYDELRAKEVSASIASIGEVTLEKGEVILQAQAMYDALTEQQKVLVTAYDVLHQAKETYENLIAAQGVIDLIHQIGQVTTESGSVITSAITAYNALTGAGQALVSNYYLLEMAAAEYDSICAVAKVEQYIEQIGVVNESSGELIVRARDAYEKLTSDQKSRVTNYKSLETAEKAYDVLHKKQEEEVIKPVGSVAGLYQNNQGNVSLDRTVPGGNGNGSNGAGVDLSWIDLENGTGIDAEGNQILESGYIPVWEEFEENVSIDGSGIPIEDVDRARALEELMVLEERKEYIVILGIVLGTCAAVTGTLGVAVQKAKKKRQMLLVQY